MPRGVIVPVVEFVTECLVHARLVYFVKEDLEVKAAKVSIIYSTD